MIVKTIHFERKMLEMIINNLFSNVDNRYPFSILIAYQYPGLNFILEQWVKKRIYF